MRCKNGGCGIKLKKRRGFLRRPNPFYEWGFCDSDCYIGHNRGISMRNWLDMISKINPLMRREAQ